MIKKAYFKECDLLQDSRFAPYAEYPVFIINSKYLIFQDEVIEDFDVEYYSEIFLVVETID